MVISAGTVTVGAVVSTDRADSVTVRVPPLMLAIVRIAFLDPSAAAWNVTTTVVESPPAMVDDSGALTVKSGASPAMPNGVVSVTLLGLPLVIVTVRSDVDPDSTDPKSIDAGAAAIPGSPVPSSGTDSAPPFELVVDSAAVFAPMVDGWNVTAIVAVAPAMSVVADGASALNIEGSVPVTVGAFTVTLEMSRFLTVVVSVRACGRRTPPKSRLVGEPISTMFSGFGTLGLTPLSSWKSPLLSPVSCSVPAAPPAFR